MDPHFFAVLASITLFDVAVIVLALIGWWHAVKWLGRQIVGTAQGCDLADEIIDDAGLPIRARPAHERRNIFAGQSLLDDYEQTDRTARCTDLSSSEVRL